MPVIDTGLDLLLRDLEAESGLEDAALVMGNEAPYASYVEDIEGFYVVDDEHAAETMTEHLEALVRQDRPVTAAQVRGSLEDAGEAEVEYLSRRPYPGGFEKRSGVLGDSYTSKVE